MNYNEISDLELIQRLEDEPMKIVYATAREERRVEDIKDDYARKLGVTQYPLILRNFQSPEDIHILSVHF